MSPLRPLAGVCAATVWTRICLSLCLLGGGILGGWSPGVSAQQRVVGLRVLDRLSGFDEQRLAAVAQWLQTPQEPERLSEAAKLLFQVNRLGRSTLALPPTGPSAYDSPELSLSAGDAITIAGTAVSVASVALPPELADVLEFERIYRVEVQTTYRRSGDDAANAQAIVGPKVYVLSSSVPAGWASLWAQSNQLDQPTAAAGVVVQSDGQGRPRVIAAPGLAWFPAVDSPVTQDLSLLASGGFNVALLDEVRKLHRKPLVPADQEPFTAMLKAADNLASADVPPPEQVDAGDLLRNAATAVGRRVRLRCQSVRITRISVTSPSTQAILGADHYWQIDALGELGDVVIRIESHDADPDPATFENRYPVSVVALRLPDFLRAALGDDAPRGTARSDVLMLSRQLLIDGFFYRLWSYESDYMTRQGGGNQFGPLLMATRIDDNEPPPGDFVGVSRIGQGAAVAAVLMLLAAGVWLYVTARQDAAARARRRPAAELAPWAAGSAAHRGADAGNTEPGGKPGDPDRP